MYIRAAYTNAVRVDTHKAFNRKSTKETVLVTNLLLGATSMNLQNRCSDFVFLEVYKMILLEYIAATLDTDVKSLTNRMQALYSIHALIASLFIDSVLI